MPLAAPVWCRRGLSLPYWGISSGLSAAVTAPVVIEFGLFSLQTLTPDFIEGDGIWKVGDTGRQTLFLYIRWCTELESLMWEMSARPCSAVLSLLPFLSPPEDKMLWMSESLSALRSWRLKLESCVHAGSEGGILAAVWLKDGAENEALERDFLWSDSSEHANSGAAGRPYHSGALRWLRCSSRAIMICSTDQHLGVVSSALWLTAEHWFRSSHAGGEVQGRLTPNYHHTGNSEYSPISLNIDR